MKRLIIIVVLISNALIAQDKDTASVYLDGIKVNPEKIFINPENIKNVWAGQLHADTLYTTHQTGPLHIERIRKNQLICLKRFIQNSESLKGEAEVCVVVNGKLFKKPEEYFIEEEAIKTIEIIITNPARANSHLWRTPALIITTK